MIVREYEKIFADNCPNFDELIKFAQASEFLSLGWQFVQAKSYVGVIQLPSGFQLEILPKIYEGGDEIKLRRLVVEMICTLKDFKFKKFLDADLDTARLNLYEIFISIYLEMVQDLVKRGLKSSYVVHEENLLNDFDSITQSTNFAKDFAAVSIDRTNSSYRTVMEWTKIFLRGESFTPFAGKSRTMALMFDMNKLFEAYVAEHIKKYFSDRFTVRTQVREKFLFCEPQDYILKPDILLERDGETIIMDTKWKFEPNEADMYQMFAYARRYGAKKIYLLCPPNVKENIYRAEDFDVQIVSVDLFDMKNFSAKLNKLF